MDRIITFLDIISWLTIFVSVVKLINCSIGYYKLADNEAFKMLVGVSPDQQVPFSVFLVSFAKELFAIVFCGIWLLTAV
jgi:hypothetical protein